MDLPSLNSLGFMTILAPVILFYQQSKTVIVKIFRVFWKKREVSYDFATLFYLELAKKSAVFNFDDYKLPTGFNFLHKSRKISLPVVVKMFSFELMFYKNIVPIFVFGKPDEKISIHYLKYTFPFEKFLANVVKERYDELCEFDKATKKNRFCVEYKRGMSLKEASFTKDISSPSNSFSATSSNPENYILDPWKILHNKISNRFIGAEVEDFNWNNSDTKKNKYQKTQAYNLILGQVESWLNAESWYSERNIAWRRGALLYGKTGSGKSSLVLEVARETGLPVYVFDLSTMDNSELNKNLASLPYSSGIILIEDIDCVFNLRKNVTSVHGTSCLTFDCLLNELSGVKSITNKFVFITTNNIEALDDALIRPGRIDEIIEIPPLTREEKLNLASIVLDNKESIEKIMINSENMSVAEFENACVREALDKFWKK